MMKSRVFIRASFPGYPPSYLFNHTKTEPNFSQNILLYSKISTFFRLLLEDFSQDTLHKSDRPWWILLFINFVLYLIEQVYRFYRCQVIDVG